MAGIIWSEDALLSMTEIALKPQQGMLNLRGCNFLMRENTGGERDDS